MEKQSPSYDTNQEVNQKPKNDEEINDDLDLLYSGLFSLENGPAYRTLEHLLTISSISKTDADKYKESISKIFSMLMQKIDSEKQLLRTSKDLEVKLGQIAIELEKLNAQSYQDSALIADLKRELLKGQNESSLCMERDSKLENERDEQVKIKLDVLSDIEQARQHKVDMLEPQLVASNKELRLDILQRKQQIENLKKDFEEKRESYDEILKTKERLDVEQEKYSISLTKASELPPKLIKQNEILKDAIYSLQQETVKQSSLSLTLDTEIIKLTKKKQEIEKDRNESQTEVETKMLQIEALEAQTDEIFRNHELAKEQLSIQKTEKIKLDYANKHCAQDIRKEHDNLLKCFRDKENMLKLYVRLENQVNNIRNLIPKLEGQKNELDRALQSQQQENKIIKAKIRNSRQEIDIDIFHYLQQDDLDIKEREALQQSLTTLEKLEKRLHEAQAGSKLIQQTMNQINLERDLRVRELTKVKQKLKDMKEECRVKSGIVKDNYKKQLEVAQRLKDTMHLYDSVKAERNKYVNMIQASTQKISEMREKVRILGNEVDILRCDLNNKDKDLAKKIHENAALFNIRDSLRNDVNRAAFSYKEKEGIIEQNAGLIEILTHNISDCETKLKELKNKFKSAVKARNKVGVQLLERQDEVCVLYEKINFQEGLLNEGNLKLSQLDEEIRILKLAIKELERDIELLKKIRPEKFENVNEINLLQKQLDEIKEKADNLGLELENPQNQVRFRHLDGTDLHVSELSAKVRKLEEKIAKKEETLIEKDLTLEEVTKLTIRLSEKTKDSSETSTAASKKINELQNKLKDVNNSMMATISELSLVQAKCIQLRGEKENKAREFEEAKERFSSGSEPIPRFDDELQKIVKEKERRIKQLDEMKNSDFIFENDGFEDINGVRTTAKLRPNAYLNESDNLPIPKPYGLYAPFKPTESIYHLKQFKKQILKQVEI
ncbi:hypothetical protein O9G_002452 [Rozella allomycis CSF55]|uniref:Cilia- and flagella-associated protein 58 central coiled coil domain-containing protein n=1 Tax=Rozella allomycis (strain CSF55) TaxID=988480 RepID=A0A075AZ85_ROZAC|nr:hypothetical protein O9G_002452 [Rozella allomycis CSF55]|eukprot:EPZ33889.1 hypothetical protein O9G_002452 [Rozella allomycis CSF55]